MERRKFVKQSCMACMALGAGISMLSLTSCTSTKTLTISPENGRIKVDLAAFTAESNALIIRSKILEHDILLLKLNQGFRAIYLQCTHENSSLNYNSGGIVCNAHGSHFDLEGNVTVGPADKSLQRFKIESDSSLLTIVLDNSEGN